MSTMEEQPRANIVVLDLATILDDATFQLRRKTTFADLSADLRERGQTTPIFVRPVEDAYQLISGFRRVAALRAIGETRVIARVYEKLDDSAAQLLAASENFSRKNFTEFERACVCVRLQDIGKSNDEIARILGVRRRSVQYFRSVVRHPVIAAAVESGRLSMAKAFILASDAVTTTRTSDEIEVLIEKIAVERISVRGLAAPGERFDPAAFDPADVGMEDPKLVLARHRAAA